MAFFGTNLPIHGGHVREEGTHLPTPVGQQRMRWVNWIFQAQTRPKGLLDTERRVESNRNPDPNRHSDSHSERVQCSRKIKSTVAGPGYQTVTPFMQRGSTAVCVSIDSFL